MLYDCYDFVKVPRKASHCLEEMQNLVVKCKQTNKKEDMIIMK